jgi:hypothetical protein
MGETSRVGTALGAAGESVMSLYAIVRLLKSRDLGPAQLGPALEANRAQALRLEPVLRQLFELLREATAESPELGSALDLLEPHAMSLGVAFGEAFAQPASTRLGARERLELERRAERLGAELEGVRALLALVAAAVASRPGELDVDSVIEGRSNLEPAFVARTAAVRVRLAGDCGFLGDPHVLWPLLEAAFRDLAGQGDELLLSAGSAGGRPTEVRISASASVEPTSGNGRLKLALGSPVGIEREVVRAVARHVGFRYEVAEAERAITIALG